MKKNVLALTMVLVLIIGVLTGCSPVDTEYFNLYRDMMNLKSYKMESKVMIKDNNSLGSEYNLEFTVKGGVNVSDLNKMFGDLEIDITDNGTKIGQPISVKMIDNKLFIRKTSLTTLMQLGYIIENQEELEKEIKNIQKMFENEYKDIDYIVVDYGETMEETNLNENSEAISTATADYIKRMFEGFDSGVITKLENGSYNMKLDGKALDTLATNIINFLYSRRDHMYGETLRYMDTLIEINKENNEVVQELRSIQNQMITSKQDIMKSFDETINPIQKQEIKIFEEALSGFHMVSNLKREGLSMIQEAKIELREELNVGNRLFNMTVKTKVTPSRIEKPVTPTGKTLGYEKLVEIIKSQQLNK